MEHTIDAGAARTHTLHSRDALFDTMMHDARVSEAARDTIEGWIGVIDATHDAPRMALKTWLQAHDGAQIDTLQARVTVASPDYTTRGLWAPGARILHAGATFATFAGSRRDYGGVHAVAATDAAWIGWDNDADTMIVYLVA